MGSRILLRLPIKYVWDILAFPLVLITVFAISLNIESQEYLHPVAFNRVLSYIMFGTGIVLAMDFAWVIHTVASGLNDELPFCVLAAFPWGRLNFKIFNAIAIRGQELIGICILDRDERGPYSFDREF
jgi:hypothetical protein